MPWYKKGIAVLCGLLFLSASALAQNALPVPKFTPPDVAQFGLEAFYADLALVETSCSTVEEMHAMWRELTERGALISIIASPRKMLAWVPQNALAQVRAATLPSARGTVGVLSVSYTPEQVRSLRKTVRLDDEAMAEAEDAIEAFLIHAKTPRTEEELARIREQEQKIALLEETMPHRECVTTYVLPTSHSSFLTGREERVSLLGGPGAQTLRATRMSGIIVNSSFFMESATGTGSWNWADSVYNNYRILYAGAMNFWTALASKYGVTATSLWLLYSPSNSNSRVTGEPVTVGEDTFIPQIVNRFTSTASPDWSGVGAGAKRSWVLNNERRSLFLAQESILGFIAFKPSGDEGIWPHAVPLTWNNGDIEGTYFTMDTQYWQAELTPANAPLRNVIAHEIGHLFGAPDEYAADAGCFNWTYRGIGNINCQQPQPAIDRPGRTMRGFDGMMKGNYISGNSVATPIHIGLRTAPSPLSLVRTRCFSTVPAGITMFVSNCDGGERSYSSTICLPVDFDYCLNVRVPATAFIASEGKTGYFDHWEIKRADGTTTTNSYTGLELKSNEYGSTRANPVVDIIAHFTTTPPDIFTANSTLTAWLAPSDGSANPGKGIALKWRNKYDMTKAETRVEYERSPGVWTELSGSNYRFAANAVPVNNWTGVLIVNVPNGSGGTTPLAANTLYRFRIVGYFATTRGTVSNTAEIRLRPASPADSAYCYDATEPNSESTPRLLTSSGPGTASQTLHAACPIAGITGEFTWNTPKRDFYRITTIGLSNSITFGEQLYIKVKTKPGSNFKPQVRAKRAGGSTYINGHYNDDDSTYTVRISSDGEYVISVEPQISTYISYDLVDRTGGHFGFAEYTLTVSRASIGIGPVTFCPTCVRLDLARPAPGHFSAKPPYALFNVGMNPDPPFNFDLLFRPDPGFEFEKFGGDFGDKTDNPLRLAFDKNSRPGMYQLSPFVRPIDPKNAELVLVYPDGPAGPVERRITRPIGTMESAVANVPSGFVFVGWGGDTTSITNPLPVRMWKSKRLIAHWRKIPCQGGQVVPWRHQLVFMNARQNTIDMTYGMEAGASDSLEAGQTGLPPIPPVGAYDVRFINIPASQGSLIDLRALTETRVYQGRVQTGTSTAPVRMTWPTPPTTPDATFTLKVQGDPTPIDMKTTNEYVFALDGVYVFTIEVKVKSCPPPTKESDITITTTNIDTRDYPCINIEVLVRDRKSGEPVPLYDPMKLKVFEADAAGGLLPAQLTRVFQRDSVIVFRLCGDGPDKPKRPVRIIPDNQDPDVKDDTTSVDVTVPLPDGNGTITRMTYQWSGDWEMVSLPLDVANPTVASLFTDPATRLFEFPPTTGVYTGASSMQFGKGYWLKTTTPATTFQGYEKNLFVWSGLSGVGEPYGYGWNLIGALSRSVPVTSLEQSPPGSVLAVFGWNPSLGYVVPTTFEPTRGYWVRTKPGTSLTLRFAKPGSDDGIAYSRVLAGVPAAGLLTITSSSGAERTLLLSTRALTADEADLLQLPQRPPDGAEDVRTLAGTRVLEPGVNDILLQTADLATLSLYAPNADVRMQVLAEDGSALGDLRSGTEGGVTVPVTGRRILRVTMQAAITPVASGFTLAQNYPNPFSAMRGTVIPVQWQAGVPVRMSIYDALGRVVRVLVQESPAQASAAVEWDGRDDRGLPVGAGVYLCRVEQAGQSRSIRLTVVK